MLTKFVSSKAKVQKGVLGIIKLIISLGKYFLKIEKKSFDV